MNGFAQGIQSVGNFFATTFTGLGAGLGLTKVYNPDDSKNALLLAQEQARAAQAFTQAQAARNQTILTVAGMVILLLLILGLGYVAFIKD